MFIPLHDANHLRFIRLQYVTIGLIAANALAYFGTVLAGENFTNAAVLGLGVEPDHCVDIVPLAKCREQNAALIRRELDYQGVSVIIARRECIQTLKRRNSKKAEATA